MGVIVENLEPVSWDEAKTLFPGVTIMYDDVNKIGEACGAVATLGLDCAGRLVLDLKGVGTWCWIPINRRWLLYAKL